MWQIRNAARELELHGRTIFFIVFLALGFAACLYYAVTELLSEL
jgi:hypothetical protein